MQNPAVATSFSVVATTFSALLNQCRVRLSATILNNQQPSFFFTFQHEFTMIVAGAKKAIVKYNLYYSFIGPYCIRLNVNELEHYSTPQPL